MSTMTANRSRRLAGPLFGLFLLVVVGVLAFTPLVPAVGATDPTPVPEVADSTPEATPEPTADPTPAAAPDPTPALPAEATPQPTAEPTSEPSVAPTDDPGATLDPSPTPDAPPDPSDPPDASPDPSASPDPGASPDPSASPDASPDPSQSPAPTPVGLHVEHVWIDATTGIAETAVPGPVDAPRVGMERFRVYLVRFQLANDADHDLGLTPRLEFGAAGDAASFRLVPAVDPADGVAFYAAADDGASFRPRSVVIATTSLRLDAAADPAAAATAGRSIHGVNPAGVLRLPAHSFTEIAFAVRATADAAWLATYELRLADAGTPLPGPAATVALRAKPSARLSPGQRAGLEVDPGPTYRLDPAAVQRAQPAAEPRYALLGPRAAGPSPHGSYALATDACASCHVSHTGQQRMLLAAPEPQATQCLTCHDGTGADANVAAQLLDPAVPPNDPPTAAWYSHPAAAASTHASDREDELGGTLDRHAECADCHQPHNADGSLAVETAAGWTASGALKGASGVAVTNGAAGSAPTYAWQPTSEFEYQLCFKCHSGFTRLPAGDPAHPSRWALDKGVELNPANLSYHPVEAAGTNQTAQMAASLAGTSPYKLWTFQTTATVRCTSCHGDSRQATPATPPDPGARLAPHAVANQGLLIASYRNGDPAAGPTGASGLKASFEGYAAADFALCYTCHAEQPFVDPSGDAVAETSFRFHGRHTIGIAGEGTGGTDIDIDGDGQGNAICAECHFRTHGTAQAVDGQPATERLVSFSPNVQPRDGRIEWTGGASPTCTLVCHGRTHTDYGY